jgi:hypothetical protein
MFAKTEGLNSSFGVPARFVLVTPSGGGASERGLLNHSAYAEPMHEHDFDPTTVATR